MSKYQIAALTLSSPFYKGDVSCFGASFYIDGKLIDKFVTTDFGIFIEKGKFPKSHADLWAKSGKISLSDPWSRYSIELIDETLGRMNKEFDALLETENVDISDETTYHSYFRQRLDRISAQRLSEMALLVPTNPDGTKNIEVLADNAATHMFIANILVKYPKLFRDFKKFPKTNDSDLSGWSLYKFDQGMDELMDYSLVQKFLGDPFLDSDSLYRRFNMMRETVKQCNDIINGNLYRFINAELMAKGSNQ